MLKALIILFFVAGCTAIKAPTDFVYKEIPTRDFTLAAGKNNRSLRNL